MWCNTTHKLKVVTLNSPRYSYSDFDLQFRRGKSPNAEEAKLIRRTAQQGFASAQKNLGVLYGLGQGVPQNDAKAFIWSSIAAMSGNEGVVNNRDFAASKLSSEDLNAAQERAAKLHEEIQQRKMRE